MKRISKNKADLQRTKPTILKGLKLGFAFFALTFFQCSLDHTLHWNEADGYRWSEVNFSTSKEVGFTAMSNEETQVVFQNELTEELIVRNHVLLNGSGLALGDVDGDGLTDIYFCRLDGPNVLYKNLGDWKFQDVTENAGVACPDEFSTGAVFSDLDGDFDLDLLVTSIGGKNFFFLNDGKGVFTEESEKRGLKSGSGATTMALADIDGDGDLDLYVTNYKALRANNIFMPHELNYENIIEKDEANGTFKIREKYQGHYDLVFVDNFILWEERGEPDALYLNDGEGRFELTAPDAGAFFDEAGKPVETFYDWGLAAKFQDVNNDGHPDLYVCNDFNSPDRIWMNDGTGRFQAIKKQAIRHTSHSSMAVDFADVERDGDLDVFVIDMLGMNHQRQKMQFNTMPPTSAKIGALDDRLQYMRNTLLLNAGHDEYTEIGRFSGVHASDWSWSANFLDIDLDGYEDILIATGQISDTQNMDVRKKMIDQNFSGMANAPETILRYPRLPLPNVSFRNNGDLTFTETSDEWRWGGDADISHGMALGDLDNDGDLDVVVNRFQQPAGLFRNDASQNRVTVRLRGAAPNTQGVGAKIRFTGNGAPQMKEATLGGSYLSGNAQTYTFAAVEGKAELALEITWRNGAKSKIEDVQPNRIYEIFEEGAQTVAQESELSSTEPFFKNVDQGIDFKHSEELFDDFSRQPLLPLKLSQPGPGVAVQDTDFDGDDDLFITSGRNGKPAHFENLGDGSWRKRTDALLAGRAVLDQPAVLSWVEGDESDGKVVLVTAFSNYENPAHHSFVLKYVLERGKTVAVDTIFTTTADIGPLAAADYDNDDDLDLFVGGRSTPGQYPTPPSSFLLINEDGAFKPDDRNNKNLQNFGMVSQAIFSDIDHDHDPDLIIAEQWGPVTVFRNEQGVYRDATEKLGLDKYLGLWNGLTTADIDGDGRLDILATNWGRNSRYSFDPDYPIRLFYGDLDRNGTTEVIEAFFEHDLGVYVPYHRLEKLIQATPFTQIRMPTFSRFANSGLDKILGTDLANLPQLSINTLDNTLFINRSDGFSGTSLPDDANFSPAFHVGAADFDNDGDFDVFLSQNFFGELPEYGKSDAGRGLWLENDGTGKFRSVSSAESGVRVYGEQRGAGFGDFNSDGRIDFVVSQNGAAVELFQNKKAKPGLRIKLRYKAKNYTAVGAKVRTKLKDGSGPLYELKAGSGYRSQGGSTIIAGNREEITGVEVLWPDGKIAQFEVPPDAKEVVCYYDGRLETRE